MSINKSCFDDAMKIITEILKNNSVQDKDNRIDKIKRVYNKMVKEDKPDREFYSLVHEIKSFEFINLFGKADLANDEGHEKGTDILFGDNRIECVCCSEGNIVNVGFKDHSVGYCEEQSIVIDYNKTKEFVLPRITNSLDVKRDKIIKYINEDVIKPGEHAILFISLGELNVDFYAGKYGKEFLEVLIGKGPLCYVFDKATKKLIGSYWKHNKYIKKNKGEKTVDIDAIFFNENNSEIAGIILSTASVYEKYDMNNTFLFLNPYAKSPIDTNDFKGIIYWTCNDNNEYIPMKDGKKLWGDLSE